jgi:hypothetical protein
MDIDHVLGGEELLSVSHAGGEFAEILGDEMRQERSVVLISKLSVYLIFLFRGMRKDNRDRRDRVRRRTQAFQQLLPEMVDAYLLWSTTVQDACYSEYQDNSEKDVGEEDAYPITVLDVFRAQSHTILTNYPDITL